MTLEAEIGAPVFHRVAEGDALTAAGKAFERPFQKRKIEMPGAPVRAVEDYAVPLRFQHFLEHQDLVRPHDSVLIAMETMSDDVARLHELENLRQRQPPVLRSVAEGMSIVSHYAAKGGQRPRVARSIRTRSTHRHRIHQPALGPQIVEAALKLEGRPLADIALEHLAVIAYLLH